MASLRLLEGEVHLWYDVLKDQPVDSNRSALPDVLSQEEWDSCHGLDSDDARAECLAAHAMLRNILSQYVPSVPPSAWQFDEDADGRQVITQPSGTGTLRFNLSYADGIVACIVSAHYDVGVEVGRVGRHPPLEIGDTGLSKSEAAALRTLGSADQPRRLLEYWTLKQAFAKARGNSRPFSPRRLSFDVSRPGRPQVRFDDGEFEDDESAWQFDRLFIGTEHVVALATRRGFAPMVAVVVRAFDIASADDA